MHKNNQTEYPLQNILDSIKLFQATNIYIRNSCKPFHQNISFKSNKFKKLQKIIISTHKKKEIDQKFNIYLTRSNDDVVDWNKDKLNEKPNESHHNETNRGTNSNLGEFFAIGFVATLNEPNAVFGEFSEWIEDGINGVHFRVN